MALKLDNNLLDELGLGALPEAEKQLLLRQIYEKLEMNVGMRLTDQLIKLSDATLRRILPLYQSGTAKPLDQAVAALPGHTTPTYTRKLTKADGILDFNKPAVQLAREVRAYAGWPGSRTNLGGKDVIITAAHVSQDNAGTPGSFWRDGKRFGFHTSDGIFEVDQIKPAGKMAMTAEAFVAGYRI